MRKRCILSRLIKLRIEKTVEAQTPCFDVGQAASLEEVGGRGVFAVFGGAPKAINASALFPNCICIMRRTNNERRVAPAMIERSIVFHDITKKQLSKNAIGRDSLDGSVGSTPNAPRSKNVVSPIPIELLRIRP